MTDKNTSQQPTPDNQEPFIPPSYLLILSGLGFFAALVVALTQPNFGVIGYGGVAFGILALLAWVLMSPSDARDALTGRTVRFGGTSLIVTLVVIGAMIAVYTLVRNANVRWDLTQQNTFSLSQQGREAIAGLGADPSLPPIRMYAFYSALQVGSRDQHVVLFDDYVATSNGKITYEFIDPNHNPQIAAQYGIMQDGQIAVVAVDAEGNVSPENAEIVSFLQQDLLTNAILKVSASGDFRAYFLTVENGLTIEPSVDRPSISILNDSLTGQFDWTTQAVSMVDLQRAESGITLNDPSADGEVLVIVGGTKPLTDDEIAFLKDYVDKGGDLVIFSASNLKAEEPALAAAENMSEFLWETFGARVNNDMILDATQAYQTPLLPVISDFDDNAFITTNGIPPSQKVAVVELPQSIELRDTLPENIRLTVLARTGETSYAKADLSALLDTQNPDVSQNEDDAVGPFIVGVQAENVMTGARLVLFGSPSFIQDDFAMLQSTDNAAIGFNSLIWTTRFNDFFSATNIMSAMTPQEAPIFADAQTVRNINFFTVFFLPFGMLALGVYVWWNNRERITTSR